MSRGFRILAPLVAAVLLAVSAAAAATALAADHEVAIREAGFDPPTITVLTGEPVTWTNETSADHTVTTDDKTLDSGPIGPGEAYGHVFEAPGTFAYRDTGASGFSGTVVVRAAPVTPPPSGSQPPSPPAGTLPPDFSPLPAASVGGGSSAPSGSPAPSTAAGGVPAPIWLFGLLVAAAAAAYVLVRRTRRPDR